MTMMMIKLIATSLSSATAVVENRLNVGGWHKSLFVVLLTVQAANSRPAVALVQLHHLKVLPLGHLYGALVLA